MKELVPVEKKLSDFKGQDHLYSITPFSYDEGFDLGMVLGDLIGGPIGEGLKAMLSGGDFDLDDVDDKTMGRALAELTSVPRRILTAGGSKLVKRILTGTVRMDEGSDGKLYKQNLEDADARTEAYAAGNQAESLQAMRAVMDVNYGPFLGRLSKIVSPYLSGLESSLMSFGQPSPENPEESEENGKPTDSQPKTDSKS